MIDIPWPTCRDISCFSRRFWVCDRCHGRLNMPGGRTFPSLAGALKRRDTNDCKRRRLIDELMSKRPPARHKERTTRVLLIKGLLTKRRCKPAGQAAPLLSRQRAAQGALYSCQLSGERDQDGAHPKIYGGRGRSSDRRQRRSARCLVVEIGRGVGNPPCGDGRFRDLSPEYRLLVDSWLALRATIAGRKGPR